MYTTNLNPSNELSHLPARNVRQFKNFNVKDYRGLRTIGIDINDHAVHQMMDAREQMKPFVDAIQGDILANSFTTPIQFLQTWLPGFVNMITAARKIDKLVGRATVGSWEDEEIIQGSMELTGGSVPYGDYTNTPFSSWQATYERRTIVSFEEGLQVGLKEAARAARVRIDSAGRKRAAAALALEIRRNSIGFNGFNNGANRTYGFLNDPNLPAYVAVVAGANGLPWSGKTYAEIQKDILTAVSTIRNNSKDVIDPKATPMTLAVATTAVDRLAEATDFGVSVLDWLQKNYPNIRIESAPELNAANGGANVFYLYADKVEDGDSDDDGRVFSQNVPVVFKLNGAAKYEKKFVESYSNATAGILLKRPYAVVRFTGI
jgi:hypothetical protein